MVMVYEPYNAQEQQDRQKILYFLNTEENLFTRDNTKVHFTASPWIINQDHTKVCMIHHNIYQSWGWCGGHADGEQDLLQVAIKEGKEETGIRTLLPYNEELFAIDVVPVLEHEKQGNLVKAHYHVNFTFLCVANEDEMLSIKPDENSGVQWILNEEINTYVKEQNMKPIYRKLKEKTECMYKPK